MPSEWNAASGAFRTPIQRTGITASLHGLPYSGGLKTSAWLNVSERF